MLSAFARADPVAGFTGGLLIGLAAALMLLVNGRIAGVSGLLARATGLAKGGTSRLEAWLFVLGLPLGAWLSSVLAGPASARFPPSTAWLLAGGLVVGFGTRLGSGCTSGHGVCGVSRLSPRSLAATGAFMLAGMATVTLLGKLGAGW